MTTNDTPAEVARLLSAVAAFLALPNWENRVGPWKDINKALAEVAAAYTAVEKEPTP